MLQKLCRSYIPAYMGRAEADVIDWHINFRDKLTSLHLQYNITTGAFNQYSDAVTLTKRLYHFRRNLKAYGKQLTNDFLRLLVHPGEVQIGLTPATVLGPDLAATTHGGIVQLVHRDWLPNRLRPNPLFTRDQQKYLGFIATPRLPVDWTALTPTLTALNTANGVLIRWRRCGADGLSLEADRNDGQGWHPIHELRLTKWYDTAQQPRIATDWRYRATYLKADRRVGQTSLETKVLVQG
jgi:hypothetical protein